MPSSIGRYFFENNLQLTKKGVILQPRKRNDVLTQN
jgi:hypothetical protein